MFCLVRPYQDVVNQPNLFDVKLTLSWWSTHWQQELYLGMLALFTLIKS